MEELVYLKSQFCYNMQSYYFSKPLPADEVTKLLQSELISQLCIGV